MNRKYNEMRDVIIEYLHKHTMTYTREGLSDDHADEGCDEDCGGYPLKYMIAPAMPNPEGINYADDEIVYLADGIVDAIEEWEKEAAPCPEK